MFIPLGRAVEFWGEFWGALGAGHLVTRYPSTLPGLRFTVPGIPQPQGSIRSLGKGRPSIHGNAARLLPWRAAVTAHCQQAMHQQGGAWPLSGPVSLRLTLVLPKPASAPKSRLWPDKRPDLSHLLRAVEDAVTASGAWQDDGQVCVAVVGKQFPDETSPGPCAVIEIRPIGGQE